MTGREIERALLQAVDNDDNISLFGHHFAIDLLTCQVGICFYQSLMSSLFGDNEPVRLFGSFFFVDMD